MTIYSVDIQPTSLANKIEMTYQHMAKVAELKGGINRILTGHDRSIRTVNHSADFTVNKSEFALIVEDFGKGLEINPLYKNGVQIGWTSTVLTDNPSSDFIKEVEKTVRYPSDKKGELFKDVLVGNLEIKTIYSPKQGAKFYKNGFKQNLHIEIKE